MLQTIYHYFMPYVLFFVLCVLSFPVFAQTITEDHSAVRVLAYYGVGYDESPATSVTVSQFKSHLKELHKGNYNVVALPDVIAAYEKNAPLPHNSVILTFDGSHKSIVTHAAPLLKEYKFPFTVFLAPERVRENTPRYLNHKDIKRLQKLQLVSFGIHPKNYEDQNPHDTEIIRGNINHAVSFYRDLFQKQPEHFSFPHGLYSANDLAVIKNYNFKALFGQQSSVAYRSKKNAVWPRFLMTENYADMTRFRMVANALPLPADDINPTPSIIGTNEPLIGFTAAEDINLKKLSCYATGQEKPSIERLGNRIEIRLQRPITEPRFRVNCTLPVINENNEQSKRWRWFGWLLSTDEDL